ncbi:MAG: hypothetical protein PGN29_16385 [Gordonia paraffinivorans]
MQNRWVHRVRLRMWRALTVVLMIAAGLVVASVATTASAQSTVPTTDTSSVVDASGATVSGGPVLPHDAGRGTPTGQAISALVGPDPRAATALVPAGFASAMGYTPVVDDGEPANPLGGCSSPIALPAAFDAPCKTHDLGYDLLRFSALTGTVQGPWAREALDAQLVRRVDAECAVGDDACRTAAELVQAGVRANSHRQDEGVPVVETPTQIVTSVVRLIWIPVERVADALGTPAGRAVTAAVLVWALVGVWRGSGGPSGGLPGLPSFPSPSRLRRPRTRLTTRGITTTKA